MKKNIKQYVLPVLLIFVLSFSRVIPHPPNFTPIIAIGIFSAFYFKNFYLSLFIVIFSMFLGDIYLGFHNTMLFTYVASIFIVIFGLFIKHFKFSEVLLAGLVSSISFFLITNFGAWLTLDMYEKNLSGLANSYLLALPFFHNTLLSTLLYLVVIKLFFDFSIKRTAKITS